jgi:hypothetical protein
VAMAGKRKGCLVAITASTSRNADQLMRLVSIFRFISYCVNP